MKVVIEYFFCYSYKLIVHSAVAFTVEMQIRKHDFFSPGIILSLFKIHTEMKMNKLYNRGVERAKVTSLPFFPWYGFPFRYCKMIYYLHEGGKNSNETIIRQEYLINGSNIFSKVYLTQLFLDNHLNSIKSLLL